MKRVFLTLALSSFVAVVAKADVLRVGREAPTLIATVALANEGDVVEVPAGEWAGPLRIEHRITLRGTGGTIDGGGDGTIITVVAPGAVLENLIIQNSGNDLSHNDACIRTEPEAVGAVLRGNTIRECAFGIWIHTTPEVQIIDNDVTGREELRTGDRGNGIQLFDAHHLVVRNNEIRSSRDGIYVSATEDSLIEGNHTNGQRFGIHYMFSYRNTLRNNQANDNVVGLALMESRDLIVEDNEAIGNERTGLLFRDAQTCQIRRNHLEGNGQGMFFFSSTDNVIVNNRIVGNEVGAKVWAGSIRNEVRANQFVANRQQVFYVGAEDLVWGETGGNVWSDYVGWDQDGDGVGERPHRVDSFGARLVHTYPAAVLLMRSPSLEMLSRLEAQMPVLRVPTVVDIAPLIGESP